MQGQTESLPLQPSVPGAFEYLVQTDGVRPLAHPVGEDIQDFLLAAHEGHGSLLPDFCRAYRRACGADVLAIHVAKGATVLADWDPAGERYAVALQKMRAGIRKAASLGGVGRIYYIWLQGESDALAGTARQDYCARLIEYKDALKRDIKIRRFGIIRVGYFASDPRRDRAIMHAQDDAAKGDRDFLVLTRLCARMSRDPAFLNPAAPGHYNNRGMQRIGEAAGKRLGKAAAADKS